MPEPVQIGIFGAILLAFTSYFAGIDTGVVLGAFFGALFFMTKSKEYGFIERTIYAIISFFIGLQFARPLTDVISSYLKESFNWNVKGTDAVISFVTAFLAIKFFILLSDVVLPRLAKKYTRSDNDTSNEG